jgi:phosphatidylinositol alpha-1,6-mannosyltransferase
MLAIVPDAFGGRGGIAQYNRDFLGAAAESDIIFSIIVLPRTIRDPYTTRTNIRQMAPRPGKLTYTAYALRTALLRPVDVVFCGHLFMASLAALIARLKKAKLILQAHGIEAWPTPQHRAAAESADLVLSVSRYTRAAVLSWANMAPERVIVLPNTVRNEFTPGEESKLRATLGLQGKRVLLTVGRMDSQHRYKGQDRVIRALPRLLEMGHDVHYLIAGEGDDRARLERLVLATRLVNRVHFLGPVTSQQLAGLYRAADLYVMPSTGEGFGIAFLEAMASGIPALGLNFGGAPDVLADGELGVCVPEVDLLEAIHRTLTGPKPDPNALAIAARARFGRERFGAGVRSALNRLLESA